MSTPAAKRRRIDAASTLSKPFRSPFKTPFKSPLKKALTPTAQSSVPTPLKTSFSNDLPVLSDKPINLPSTTPNRPRVKKTFSSPVSAAVIIADPDIAPMLRAQRELERQLRDLKEELEAAEQATKIEKDSRKKDPDGEVDGELIVLIEKWKGASRQAAEELFGKVRDRVNRMGGPRAWKEMQKKQQEDQNSWEDEQKTANDDNDDPDDDDVEGKERDLSEKRDLYAEYGMDPETENEKSQRDKGIGDTGELPGQEDEFTMAMMLRTLNVDLDIIGYDKQQQRWID